MKVPFGLFAVVEASLLGWLAQFYNTANPALVFAAGIATIVVGAAIFLINRAAYRCIEDIGES